MADMSVDDIINLAEQLHKDGYNPNTIRIDLEQLKRNLVIFISNAETFDDVRTTLETYLAIIGTTNDIHSEK